MEQGKKENLNNTKRYSILKPSNEELNFEENTKLRRSRRVSFAAKVDFKTLDESKNGEHENSNRTILVDVLNRANAPLQDKVNTDDVEMECEDDSKIDVNEQITMNQTNLVASVADYSILPSIGKEGDGGGSQVETSIANETMSSEVSITDTVPFHNKIACAESANKYCTPSINNVTHSIVVEASRQLSHLSEISIGGSGGGTAAGILQSMADSTTTLLPKKADMTYTLPVVEKSAAVAGGDHDEGINEVDKGRQAVLNESLPRHLNVTQTLEKLTMTSFMAFKGDRDINRTLETSGRSFLVPALIENDLRLPQLNLSTNISLRAIASSAPALNSSQFQQQPQVLNQSSIGNSGSSSAYRLPSRLDQIRDVKDLLNLIKAMARTDATATVAQQSTSTAGAAGSKDGDNLYESIKERLDRVKQSAQAILARRREAVKSAKARYESDFASVKTVRQEKEEWVSRLENKREEFERLKTDAIKHGNRAAFEFNQAHADSILNELNEYKTKNASLQKECEEKKRIYEQLKETVENTAEVLKSLQQGQNEKEGLKNLFHKLFSETNLGFKLAYYDNDTIVLLFMFGLIQVEIKGTNIVKDLKNARFQQTTGAESNQNSTDYQQVDATWQKYLNYPLEQVIVRSNIDPATNTYSSQYKSINMHSSNLFRGNRKIPVYLKYCVELVLGEIGCGNIMLSNKKIRQVKDLPMVIFHLILSSNMASRLAVDFEYFATLVSDTLPKCDFEFKNYMVHLTLISALDNCLYKLKLKVKPACYYQQAIPFLIEKAEGQIYEPNVQRIRNLIEDQYFENGSIRAYLDRLNQILNPASIQMSSQ